MKWSERKGTVYQASFESWGQTLLKLLKRSDFFSSLPVDSKVLLKPNLVEPMKPPITTPVEMVAALIDTIRAIAPFVHIIVGEGTASFNHNTHYVFRELGYTDMAREKEVELIDLNEEPLVRLTREDCPRWPVMFLPQIVLDSCLVSVPVLKAHSLAKVTLTMKNMMGCAPPSHFQQDGHWKKAAFHEEIQDAVLDLNKYRTPDFTVLDATTGMQEAHLWGPQCSPAPNLVAVSTDSVAIDAFGAGVLKKDWRHIGHIANAHEVLGVADPLNIVEVC